MSLVESSSTIGPLHWHLIKQSLLIVRETSPNLVSLNFSKLCVPYRCKTRLKILRYVLIRDVFVKITHVKNVKSCCHRSSSLQDFTYCLPYKSENSEHNKYRISAEFREIHCGKSRGIHGVPRKSVTLPHEIPSSFEFANQFRGHPTPVWTDQGNFVCLMEHSIKEH